MSELWAALFVGWILGVVSVCMACGLWILVSVWRDYPKMRKPEPPRTDIPEVFRRHEGQ